jgi:integrase
MSAIGGGKRGAVAMSAIPSTSDAALRYPGRVSLSAKRQVLTPELRQTTLRLQFFNIAAAALRVCSIKSRATGQLTGNPLPQANAYAMIQRRAKNAGITTRAGNHTFRATGVTAYLKNGGTLERAAQMANHASTRTTQLYDRRAEEVTLDEVERILV